MASMKEKVERILWYHGPDSPFTVQQMFRNDYRQDQPDARCISMGVY